MHLGSLAPVLQKASPLSRLRERVDPVLLGLCVVAAVFAAVAHQLLFDRGSLNNDETAYLLQARAIADGHLFLPVTQPAEAYQPWFFVERERGFVSKYLPLVSTLQAGGLRLFGSVAPVLVSLAALVPLVVHGLAREVGMDRRAALLATSLVTLSPIVLMNTALPLSYVVFLVLITSSWLLLVRLALRRAGPGSALLLGLSGSAAGATRPYDAVLLLLPGLAWAVRERRADLARLVPAVVLGGLPLAIAVGVYNTAVTGKPWVLPFSLLSPGDAIGFGDRQLLPEDIPAGFSPLEGLYGLFVHFGVGSMTWYALGAVLVPAAAFAWRTARGPVRVLLVSVLVHLFGYLIFWGPYNFSVLWGKGTRVCGPIYTVALLVPVVLAGLPVLRRWLAQDRRVRVAMVVAGLLSVGQLASAVFQAAVDENRTSTLLDLAAGARAATGTKVLLDVDPPYLGHPVTGMVDGTALAATYPVPPRGAPVPQLLQLPRAIYGVRILTYALVQQERLEGPELPLSVQLVGRRSDVLVVERAGKTTACRLGATVPLTLTPTGTTGCDEEAVPPRWARDYSRHCADTSCLVLASFREDDGGKMRLRGWRRLPVDTTLESVAVLADGRPVATEGAGWLRVAAR